MAYKKTTGNQYDEHRYDDILNCEPPEPPAAHPRMPIAKRAAQFAPFKALAGQEEDVKEAERYTEEERQLSESRRDELDQALQLALTRPEVPVRITWFEPDGKKAGGAYRETSGRIRKADAYRRELVMETGERIAIDRISEIRNE